MPGQVWGGEAGATERVEWFQTVINGGVAGVIYRRKYEDPEHG